MPRTLIPACVSAVETGLSSIIRTSSEPFEQNKNIAYGPGAFAALNFCVAFMIVYRMQQVYVCSLLALLCD